MYKEIVGFIRAAFQQPEGFIALHEPKFLGNEKKYLVDAIDSTYVSSVGQYVNRFEEQMKQITGASHVVAVVNGTCALHLALLLAGVEPGEEVITQPLTFVATVNAIKHANASPHFVDVDKDTLGLSPEKLRIQLAAVAQVKDGKCFNKITGRRIAACVPMHSFGFPLRIDEVIEICSQYHIPVVEDSTESLGASYKGRATGTFGSLGTFSFNGNKTVTSGAGGAIITNDEVLGKRAKHLSTTAKLPHAWEFVHDEVGYNYRMPNLNAALACAQLEQLESYIRNKRSLAAEYRSFFKERGIPFVDEIAGASANYWLCTILLKDRADRDAFLEYVNGRQVMCRPAWTLMTKLDMFKNDVAGDLTNASWLEDRIVNIPSSVRPPL
ncbi:MAG: LegC family aminotransferase [Bacteroidota bacterium]|nr:LegC family aminotransferase [Bacteroidota bacterium]